MSRAVREPPLRERLTVVPKASGVLASRDLGLDSISAVSCII